MKKIILSTLGFAGVICSLLMAPSCQPAATVTKAPNKALIITGQNNHYWQGSTPILKQVLEDTRLFSVDIATTPEAGKDLSAFQPDFSKYQVVVLDYNGDPWPEATRKAFESYVSGGGGVVVYHAADNAFSNWKAYNQMIGLGGWGNRNEKDGPYIRWRHDSIIRDNTPGIGGSHGPQHPFQVTIRDTAHPITKGLPKVWLHAQDELYSQLRGPAENMTVLATAYADTAFKGTGENEPMLMTISYGKGRIFHTALGHVGKDSIHPAAECVGFIVTLQRGAEWAATGQVTQAVPDDFPSFNTESRWPAYRPLTLDEILTDLKNYKTGDSRSDLQDLTNYIKRHADGGTGYAETESALLKFLQSNGSNDAKNYICKELSLWGSEKSIPVLKQLQKRAETAEMATFAITRITGHYED